MQKAIIHTSTRVIRRLTTDENPGIAADETIVSLATPIDIGGGFWKLDAQNNKTIASSAEIDAADIDEVRVAAKRQVARQAMQTALDNLISSIDTATLTQLKTRLKAYFQALKGLR